MRTSGILLFVLGVLAALLAAELGLRLLPVSTATMRGYHLDLDVLTYPPYHRWQMAKGWDLRNAQTLHANNWGFVAQRDFVADSNAIALIGDSYVEAAMLDAADRPAEQLEWLLPVRRPVFALGSPGSALLDYAQRIRLASERLSTRDFVLLLERVDARQSLCGSGNVQAHCLDPRSLQRRTERESPPGRLKAVLRHSALAQYLASQIRFSPRALLDAMLSRRTPEEARPHHTSARSAPLTSEEIEDMRRRVDAVVRAFFADARPHIRGRLVVAVDGRRSGSDASRDLTDAERAHLIQRLREGGAEVLDLEPTFADHGRHSSRRLEVGPYDGHLNPLGVRLAMSQVAAAFVVHGRP